MSIGHAAAQLDRGLPEALRSAQRLQAGSRILQDLRREIGIRIGIEQRTVDLALLQATEDPAVLFELLGRLRIFSFG